MAENITSAAAKLKKLGERVRAGLVKRHPVPSTSRDIVRQTVREEWRREQEMKRTKPTPSPKKSRDRKPPEPER